jgi:hypothetical protein
VRKCFDAVILLHDIMTWTDVTRPSEGLVRHCREERLPVDRVCGRRGELDSIGVTQEQVGCCHYRWVIGKQEEQGI